MHRSFYTEPATPGEVLTVEGEEARHLIQSLRARVGESVELLNGAGRRVFAEITHLERRSLDCRVLEVTEHARPPVSVTLVQALPKSGKFDLVLQKAVELGVDAIVPLISDHAISRTEKSDRWRAVCVSALKQSGNPWLPVIHPATNVAGFIQTHASTFDQVLLADLSEDAAPLKAALQTPATSIACLVGPEGDFAPDEITTLREAGAVPVSLGPHVMRSETAAIFLMSVLRYETSA
ncbi:MAG: 16S rRNA (uracil1498-N3)-methyltransferase [Candidatus Omnitrophota bacterium]